MRHVAAKLPANWFAVGILYMSQLEGFETEIGTKDQDRLWNKVFHHWKQEQRRSRTHGTLSSVL